MSLARGTVNPLNVLGVRKLSFIPKHFSQTYTSKTEEITKIDYWISTHLNSRYCIKKSHKVIDDTVTVVHLIGFEDPTEITMLYLACPYFT